MQRLTILPRLLRYTSAFPGHEHVFRGLPIVFVEPYTVRPVLLCVGPDESGGRRVPFESSKVLFSLIQIENSHSNCMFFF